ncbi:hypothetical protein [Bacteriovorax sp. Seq25_V]|uniref:hypothetical protein n=1 Tax=Bacteriovorax sp. Seq25_V TaxID=1201288 RepID=UPI00038A3C7A|nr:hypothetical protein [Bacteriovorax sp. Seq25_V]EQC45428.1 hypothetical protein M900_2280 [Bacteriovorax sp. Seq25_V]
MKKSILIAMLICTNSYAEGLFADGFQPSNLGEAIQHVGSRIRSAHSGGGKVDLSALEKMTDEQRDKAFMYHEDNPKRRENDPRRETVRMLEEFKEDVIAKYEESDRREEILNEVSDSVKTYNRRIEGGYYRYAYERIDSCLNECYHETESLGITCYENDLDRRVGCNDMASWNPQRLLCKYESSKEYDKCRDDAGWAYQVCQSKCF